MDKYQRVRKIGEGAFGKADLVKRKADGAQMVVKEISIMRMGPKERQESKKEVSVLAQLKHPNIVAYRESFEEHGSLFIVMDFCAGGDLYARINNQRGVLFGEDQILDWFVQMCLAIKHIHDRKILHRDIKSQNIFLTHRGMVQLGDFGIAKVLNSTVELARTCIGTPYYLSPEICENKPYNNKSDIWSLGCVLYELATLKHAFEAGNMKNLVLKIIRGSYPPLSPKYSYEIRNLISALFKRAPRDRPSINSVLKKPFISQRIPKFLSNEQLENEFSHTVMHGHKLGRPLPPPPNPASRPPSAARNRPDGAGAAAASAAKKYDPSKIYGAPVAARKSKENRVPAGQRPGSAGSRPGSAASRPGSANRPQSSQELQRKKQEYIEKEKRRRDLQRNREDDSKRKEYERRHKELQDKQKMARINRAREDGWNQLVNSQDSDSSSGQRDLVKNNQDIRDLARVPGAGQNPGVPRAAGPAGDYNGNGAAGARGKYEHYNNYLDKLQKERDVRQRHDGVPAKAPPGAYMGAQRPQPQPGPRPLPGGPHPAPVWRKAPDATPIYQAHNQRGQEHAGERAKLVEDFIDRRKAAAMNRDRGNAQMFGPSKENRQRPPSANPSAGEPQQSRPSSAASSAASAASSRNREEQEYLNRLRQIRQQNYNDRRNLQAKVAADSNDDRKKKAEALKQQAEDWAKQRVGLIQKKKQEFIEKELQLRNARQNMNRGVKQAPAVPITGAINAIGATPKLVGEGTPAPKVGMTNVLGAIGVQPRIVEDEDDRPKTPIQQRKEEILRKLNSKGPPKGTEEPQESARSKWGAGKEIQFAQNEESESARSKWGAGKDIQFAQNEEPESARPQWGTPPSLDLGKITLEGTASEMEATSARDRVIINPESARRQWGRPGETVLNALQGVPLAEQTMSSEKSEDSISSPPSTGDSQAAPGVAGATITISKTPIKKGTITIRTADENRIAEESSDTTPSHLEPVPETAREQISTSPEKGRSPTRSPTKRSPVSSPAKADKEVESSQTANQSETVKETTSQSVPSTQVKPPLPAKKPSLPAKPIILPKPVLLPQPDSPMQFVPNQPVSVKTEGAGSLFQKVELEEEGEEPSRSVKKISQSDDKVTVTELSEEGAKRKTGLLMGLTMGSFDIGHRELLRTCSEPDLASLFKTMAEEQPAIHVRVKSLDDMSVVNEEEDDDEVNMDDVYKSMEEAVEMAEQPDADNILMMKEDQDVTVVEADNGNDADNVVETGAGDGEQEGGEDLEDYDEDEDLADLISVRATMQSLLIEDSEDENKKSPVKFSLSSDRESRGDTNDGDVDDTEDEQLDGNSDVAGYEDILADDEATAADDNDDDSNIDADEDGDNVDGPDGEEGDDNLGEQDEDDVDIRRSDSVDNENPQTPDDLSREDIMSQLFPTDDSDSEFNDGDEGDFDLFGRLEETRAQLEAELGAEKLIQVYKTVQALQEDEDENIEEGARIAQELLGQEKVHLYPKIFQLVMADAAFTDDSAFEYDLEDITIT